MLNGRRNRMVPLFEHTEDREVEGIGSVQREYQTIVIGTIEECRHLFARLLDHVPGHHAHVIPGPSRIDPVASVEAVHLLVHFVWFGETGRPVVQINEFIHRRLRSTCLASKIYGEAEDKSIHAVRFASGANSQGQIDSPSARMKIFLLNHFTVFRTVAAQASFIIKPHSLRAVRQLSRRKGCI